MRRKPDSCFSCLVRYIVKFFSYFLIIGLYALIVLHFYSYIKVVSPLLKKRLGTNFGMTWVAIGLILLYNIVYNHWMAMIIKPGSVEDIKLVERLRIKDK